MVSCETGPTTNNTTNECKHDKTNWIIDVEPTCSTKGSKHELCEDCNQIIKIEIIDEVEHAFSDDWSYDENNHYHECNCREKTDIEEHTFIWIIDKQPTKAEVGLKHEECEVCHFKRNINTIISSTGHDHNIEHIEYKKETCTEDGNIEYYYCTKCKKYFLDSDLTNETTYDKLIIKAHHELNHYESLDPTCTTTGYKAYDKCINCSYTTYEEIEALGHNFVNGICSRCNTDEGSSNVLYELNSDGTGYIVKGVLDKTVTELFIPQTYNNLKVLSIEKGALEGCTNLEKIVLPFIGETLNGKVNVHFSFIFGGSSYEENSTYVPSTLKEVTILDGSVVWPYSFSSCTKITNIELPNCTTSIGNYAFEGCSSLIKINIPNNVTVMGLGMLKNCKKLSALTIPFVGSILDGTSNIHFGYIFGASSYSSNSSYVPSSLKVVKITGGTSIGKYAFDDCSYLISIEIPDSVTAIGVYAFWKCSSLTSIVLPNGLTSISFGTFNGCNNLISIEIPESVTSIGSDAFRECSSLTNIKIPHGVTSIETYTFYKCSKLERIEFTNCIKTIESNAFWECNKTNAYYTGSIEDWCNIKFGSESTLGRNHSNPMSNYGGHFYMKNASGEYEEVTEIEIPNTVTTISDYRFAYFKYITKVTLTDTLTSIGKYAFYACIKLTTIEIPESVTSIGSYAFSECRSLTSIKIPKNITIIGDCMFEGCSSLTSIEIPSNLKTIGKNAFMYCTSLISIEIPESVTSIGIYAFYNCNSLIIFCEASSQPSGWDTSWNKTNCTVVWGYKSN